MFHKYSLIALLIGYLLDLIIGDPYWMWHPIKAVGWLISRCLESVCLLHLRVRKEAAYG